VTVPRGDLEIRKTAPAPPQSESRETHRPPALSDSRPFTSTRPFADSRPESEDRAEPIFTSGELVSGIYEIRSLLGEGGMAQVFEAHDHLLDRRVALKAAFPDPHAPALRTEARALARFSHPSLVTVHTLGDHRGIDYIVMERIYGVSLASHIRERNKAQIPFRVEEVLGPLALIAEGLAVVHRAGIAHRDVKPGNVMLTPDHRVVLMDFGLVLPEFEVASQKVVAGSPPYMPPEALTNTIEPGMGQLVDIYALGVIGYEMLAGHRPFPAKTLGELWEMHVHQPTPDIRAERGDLPPKLVELITEALAKDPNERPQSAEGFAWQLSAIQDALVENAPEREPREDGTFEVLVVEDDKDIARILTFYVRQILGKEVGVRHANDGAEALEMLRERAPDLMLLDLRMPRLNGIEVCMHVRGERLADGMKIVAVSAGAQEHDLQLLHQLGMHHFVQKGADLKDRLADVLGSMFL